MTFIIYDIYHFREVGKAKEEDFPYIILDMTFIILDMTFIIDDILLNALLALSGLISGNDQYQISNLLTPPDFVGRVFEIPRACLIGIYTNRETRLRPGETRLRPGETRFRPGETRLRPGETRFRPGAMRFRAGGTVGY